MTIRVFLDRWFGAHRLEAVNAAASVAFDELAEAREEAVRQVDEEKTLA